MEMKSLELLCLFALNGCHYSARMFGCAELEMPDPLPSASLLIEDIKVSTFQVNKRGLLRYVFIKSYQLAILDGDRHTGSDQRCFNMSGEVIRSCRFKCQHYLGPTNNQCRDITYLRHHDGTMPRPWDQHRARSDQVYRSCPFSRPVSTQTHNVNGNFSGLISYVPEQ